MVRKREATACCSSSLCQYIWLFLLQKEEVLGQKLGLGRRGKGFWSQNHLHTFLQWIHTRMRVEVTKVQRMTMNSNLEELLVNKGHLTGDTRWLRRNRYYTLSVLHSFFISIVADIKDITPFALNSFCFLAGLKWKWWKYRILFLLLISFIGRKNSVLDFWFNLLLSYKWRMLRTNLNLFSCQFDLIWKKRRDQTFWRVKDLNWWENTWIECRGVAFMEKWFDRYIMYTIYIHY